jgi:DNA-binding NarL/FixJ family response regulator
VLLVDDHALVRKGFRRMLEDDSAISVVAEASEGLEAVRLALELKPRVVVMDCALPGISGIDATRRIRAKMPDATVLMLSMHSEDTLVRQALEAGARGYILKNALEAPRIFVWYRECSAHRSNSSSDTACCFGDTGLSLRGRHGERRHPVPAQQRGVRRQIAS